MLVLLLCIVTNVNSALVLGQASFKLWCAINPLAVGP
jgi:hypothetical protein